MIVFVDLSYYVFHRYYAIQRWCQLAKKTFENEQEMLDKFAKLFEDNIVAMKKKHKFEWKDLYFAKDCQKETIWRMRHFPEYKKNREERNIGFEPVVFVHTYEKLMPMFQAKYGAHLVGYETAEADDVVAVLHAKVRRENPGRKIMILTNDNDYVQLADENTTIFNCNKVNLVERTERVDPAAIKHFALWKVIKGDESDNIPPIDKKIGEKVALKLAQSPELLKARLEVPEVAKQFELNRLLIDFVSIPTELRSGIESRYKDVV